MEPPFMGGSTVLTITHQQPMMEVDALDLAERSERDWRYFLNAHNIAIPS
jgi:hypothetical protein